MYLKASVIVVGLNGSIWWMNGLGLPEFILDGWTKLIII